MPLSQPIMEFVNWKGTHSKKAVEPYSLWLRRFNEHTKKPLEKIEVEDITKFSVWVQSQFSPTTHYYMMNILHCFFSFQNKRGKGLPADLIVAKRVQANSHLPCHENEYKAMLDTFDQSDFQQLRNLIIMRMLGECGMRVSELTDLNSTEIDLKERIAIIHTKKTRKERRIVWSESTNVLLATYLGQRATISQSRALFIGFDTYGKPTDRITPRSVQRIMQLALKRAGIERRLTPHSMRHYWAIDKRKKGAAISFVQAGLGHSSPLTTIDTYERYGLDEFTDEARRYLDHQETRQYVPLIRKLEQEDKEKEKTISEWFKGSYTHP